MFRQEEINQDKHVGRSDLDAMEKEISIDIAELRRDLKTLSADLFFELTRLIDSSDSTQFNTEKGSHHLARENNLSMHRQSRKNSILTEASYLAHRLSRALSNSPDLEAGENRERKNDILEYIEGNKTEENSLDLKKGKHTIYLL